MLPYTAEIYFSFLAQYNAATWLAAVVAFGLGVAVLALSFVRGRWSGRLVALLLAAGWAWSGLVFHNVHFATINFLAPVYAGVFIVEALLLLWLGVVLGRLHGVRDAYAWAGLAIALYALVGHGILWTIFGHGWPETAVAGIAPDPTALFTLGLLLAIGGRAPVWLAVLPLLWTIEVGITAWMIAMPPDYVVTALGVLAFALIVVKRVRAPRAYSM